jgi:large subunit ribosomal protein L24
MKIQKGDQVIVITGKDSGKKGKVLSVFAKTNKLIIEVIKKVKRHQKGRNGQISAIIEKEIPIWASKVMLLDPETNKPTRVGYKLDAGKNKYRVSKKTGKIIKSDSKTK